MANELEFQSSDLSSFPWWVEYNLLFDVLIYSESSVKKQWLRDRNPNVVVFVVWSTLIVGR